MMLLSHEEDKRRRRRRRRRKREGEGRNCYQSVGKKFASTQTFLALPASTHPQLPVLGHVSVWPCGLQSLNVFLVLH